jgi:hypothetical protein
MNENFIPFPDCKEATQIVNELLSNQTLTDSIEILTKQMILFNRKLDVHGYTFDDLKKVRLMKEALIILQSQ